MSHLSQKRKDEISAAAEDILHSVYRKEECTPPVNLDLVLKEYGLQVLETDFGNDEVVGAYDKASKTIYVAKNDYFPRQLFAIGHEIGHYLLHQQKEQDVFLRLDAMAFGDDGEDKPIEETEADYFAASLLMPEKLVRDYWSILHNTEQLATIFAVPKKAMWRRLVDIGMIRYNTNG